MSSKYLRSWLDAWNEFWFRPADPIVLGVMRVFVGAMVFYTHLVWTKELDTFFGAASVIPASYRDLLLGQSNWIWSHFDWIDNEMILLGLHISGLAVVGMFTLGACTRVSSIVTCLLAISYANRATGALFGLDQINCFLCLYLALGNSGAYFSIDHWLSSRRRKGQGRGESVAAKDVMSNIAIRMIQVHMCVVYLFAGIGKLQGDTWWNGTAIWYALASYEYQSLDMTWLAHQLWLVNLLTIVALAWEVSFPFLIWPRLTRPIYLGLAVAVHLGIGLAMGMLTFGLIMIIGNLSFVPSSWMRGCWGFLTRQDQTATLVAES